MRRLCCLLALLLTALSAMAQSEQRVLVVEYNGREQKTPLQDVEVAVTGAAQTVSDAQGQLTLRFRQLRAGDAVKVRRVDLSGYEVFNTEALEQWAVSPSTTFTIVMCRSDRFRQLCDQYASAANENYARQLKRDKERLEAERKAGKLKQQEYEQQLQAVQDQYDEQLEQLDLYVERFARIDLSELSEAEAAIIALVQQGQIDEAIARYEELNLLDTYVKQSDELRQINAAQDSLTVVRDQKDEARDSLRQVLREQAELYERMGEQQKADSLRQAVDNH